MTWDDRVQTRFSSRGVASKWNDMYADRTPRLDEHFFRLRRDFTVRYVTEQLAGARRILDLGCGAGPVISELRARGRDCVGLDYSFEMLGHARDRIEARNAPRTGLLQADSRKLPFADESFDAVVCLGVISYVEDYRPVLSELHRVLRPGGTTIVSFRNKFNKTFCDPVRTAKTAVKKMIRWPEGPEEIRVGRWLDHREVQGYLQDAGLTYFGFEAIGFGPPRLSGRPFLGEGPAAIRVSDTLSWVLRVPGLARLAPWLCDVSLWIYQRPHIEGVRQRVPAPSAGAGAVARG